MSCLGSAIGYNLSLPTTELPYNILTFSVTADILIKMPGKNRFSCSITTFILHKQYQHFALK